jgi:hypothetical protein
MCCAYLVKNQQGWSHARCPGDKSCSAGIFVRTAAPWIQSNLELTAGTNYTHGRRVHQLQLLACAAGLSAANGGVGERHSLLRPACSWGWRRSWLLPGACMCRRHWWGPQSLLSLLASVLHVVAAAVPGAPPVALMHVPPRRPLCVHAPWVLHLPACPACPLHTGCPARGWT